MKRILLIEPVPAIRETVALLLARDYELEHRDSFLNGAALAEAANGVDLVIASAGPAAWTAQLARLNAAVLLLADSMASAQSFAHRKDFKLLLKPFNPYDLKAEVERLLHQTARTAPARVRASDADLDFPFLTHAVAVLARRFAGLSWPVFIWGERGCGQDRVARAMASEAAGAAALITLNGQDLTADCLEHWRAQLTTLCRAGGSVPAILIEGLERLTPSGQSLLLNFIDAFEGNGWPFRILSTANADLLEHVYRGAFLGRLYYKLAKLTLPLAPLRKRQDDLYALARRFAADYATELKLDEIDFTPAARARLRDYLWFGNLDEFDVVIARTLAVHGKARIDAADLVFDFSAFVDGIAGTSSEVSAATDYVDDIVARNAALEVAEHRRPSAATGVTVGLPNLRLLVHELAHELKNPMVTIKTFAQLLAERYDDASFRARFQDVVDGDIERMDELLGVMTEYAGFDQPRTASTALSEHVNSILEAIHDDCAKRQIHVGWKGNGQGVKIMVDAAQLRYALRNTLLAVLSQAKSGSDIDLAVAESGTLAISYLREGERMQSLANYFEVGDLPSSKNIVPLRILLAREIVERSGGRFGIDQSDGPRDVVTMEFPVV
jgi:DNA-binding NtrC family response regulator